MPGLEKLTMECLRTDYDVADYDVQSVPDWLMMSMTCRVPYKVVSHEGKGNTQKREKKEL